MRTWLVAAVAFYFAAGSPVLAQSAMQQYVEAMQPGWNLGNTLDATPSETSWGNPLTTQALIQHIKAQGFKSIRIPVTWEPHMGPGPSYTIDPVWMARVQQIVDWSIQEGLYVMLNVHHDSFWVLNMPSDHDAVLARFNAIWTQLAPRFRDHSNLLMFESINEPQFSNVSDAQSMALLNELNTSFFHIVRGTGGGNATRPLVLPSLNTNSGQQYLDSLKATMAALNDSNLIATVHYYGFWPFSVNVTGVTTVNDAVVNDIFSSVNNTFNTFVADGIPVIVGELGLLNWGPDSTSVERGEALKFFEIYTAAANASGITWQLWDAGQLLNRYSFQWRDPELMGYYLQSLTTRSSTGATDLVWVKTGAPEDVVIPLSLNGNGFVSLKNGGTTLTPGVDYTLTGSDLTLKAALLEPYTTGAYGEKAVLEAHFSAGMPWKLRVRHQSTSVIGATNGNKSDGIVIPVSFNGDLVATMEGRYIGKGSPYPGPATWTPFQEYTHSYRPNYWNNTITLTKEFFAQTTNDPIDLTFHMWSGRELNYRLTFQAGGDIVANPEQLVIYEDALSAGWSDAGSWATHSFSEATTVHAGTGAISISAGAWGGVVLTNGGPAVDTSTYKTLVFWVHGGTTGGQNFGVGLNRGSDDTSPRVSIPTPQANTWTKVEIPLSSLGVEGSANITGVFFQNWNGSDAPTLYIDDLHLTTGYASHFVFVNGTPAPVISSPTAVAVTRGSALSYTVATDNDPDTVSVTGLPAWLSYNASTGVVSGTTMTPGTYHFTITVSNEVGTTSEQITVRVDPTPIDISFAEVTSPANPRVEVAYDGSSHGLTAATDPAGIPVTITYDGGSTPPTLPGSYRVVAMSDDSNYAGQAEATLVITSNNPGRLINLSMRAVAGTDSNTLIIGFVTSGGSGDIPLLVTGIGPELSNYGVPEGSLLTNPSLRLYEGSEWFEFNDDWEASLAPILVQAGTFDLPTGSKDAAVAANLPSGSYTAHITGAAGSSGIAVGEIYDLTETYSPSTPVLINASARCQVGSGSEVLIPGFVIGGSTPLRVLIRAIGPGLASEVDGMLVDPRITLFDGGDAIDSNDDWDASLAPVFDHAGAFELAAGSKDAALVVELPPGHYTGHVQSTDGSPGVALVEIYALPGL